MRRNEYAIARLRKDISELKLPPPQEQLEQLRAAYPDMTVLVPIGGRPVVTVMYSKTDERGSKQ